MSVVAKDTFTDKDDTFFQDHVPDIGGAWKDIYGSPSSDGLLIEDNQLAWNGDTDVKYLDSPLVRNGKISLTVLSTFAPCPGIIGRLNTETLDYLIFYKYFGTWLLSDGYIQVSADGDVEVGTIISMVMNDDTITAYFDDTLKATLTTTHVLDAGCVGLKAEYDVF